MNNFEEDDDYDDEMRTNLPGAKRVGPTPDALHAQTSQQLADFNELLNTLASTEDKQKSLWRQIYENAITDRMNAYLVWTDLYNEVQAKPAEHAIHGQNLSRYMERMSKANDQLIKLADLVGNAKKKDSVEVTEEDLYRDMESGAH
jgi:ethanolamine utilization protein EutQ (cupin superfamily)